MDISSHTHHIAQQLDETNEAALEQIERALNVCGEEALQTLVQEALAVEAKGGMMLPSGKRRRTLGGVFFVLLRQHVTDEQRLAIWPPKKKAPAEREPTPPQIVALHPEADGETEAVAPTAATAPATTMKITLVGRPAAVEKHPGYALFTLCGHKPPSLPKGVPAPPVSEAAPTQFVVHVAERQWDKIEPQLRAEADDLVIVEGFPAVDAESQAVLVYATNATTKKQQQAKKKAPPAARATSAKRPPARTAPVRTAPFRPAPAAPPPQPAKSAPAPALPPGKARYKPGILVRHRALGEGVVLTTTVSADEEYVVVDFGEKGRQRVPANSDELRVI